MNTCKWCSKEIERGSECDRCWELRTMIEGNPELALRMLADLAPFSTKCNCGAYYIHTDDCPARPMSRQ